MCQCAIPLARLVSLGLTGSSGVIWVTGDHSKQATAMPTVRYGRTVADFAAAAVRFEVSTPSANGHAPLRMALLTAEATAVHTGDDEDDWRLDLIAASHAALMRPPLENSRSSA